MAKIDQTPAHNAVDDRCRPALDQGRHRGLVQVVEPCRPAWRFVVHQPIGTVGVDPHHPVTHDLQRHPADPGGLAACAAILDRSQGQQAPHLRPVFRGLGCRPNLQRVVISPQQNSHGEPQPFATLNEITAALKTPGGRLSGTWYYTPSRAARSVSGSRMCGEALDRAPFTPSTLSGFPQRDLAVSKQVPEQEEGRGDDDSEENPIEHLRHVEVLPFGGVRNLRMPHAEVAGSCSRLVHPRGSSIRGLARSPAALASHRS